MKAIVRTKYGPPDILEFKDVETPVPTENQVLIKTQASSVNPVDWHILRGTPFFLRLAGFGVFKPKYSVIGADISGTVAAVGGGVTKFKVGDEVFGSAIGGYAEYACYREIKLAIKPKQITFEQAAAIPVAGLTALQGLRDHGRIQAGHRVLINGASGGVGTFAVQIAKALGADVTGVCSGKNAELVRSIGADQVIDYTKEDYTKGESRYDLILDNAAPRSIRRSIRALTPTGMYVLVGGAMMAFLQVPVYERIYSGKGGKGVRSMLAKVDASDLEYLGQLVANGKVVPVIERTYALRETAEALRYVESGHTRGKVVIAVIF